MAAPSKNDPVRASLFAQLESLQSPHNIMTQATEHDDPGTERPLLPLPTKPGLDVSSSSSPIHLSPKITRRNITVLSLINIWKYDLLLCALSLIALVALVSLLSTQHGRRQRTWADGTLTLNTAIWILSTVIRSSVVVPVAAALTQQKWLWFRARRSSGKGRLLWDYEVFDRASKGVPGSVQLLGTTGLRCVR
jgi:hypothetical protein